RNRLGGEAGPTEPPGAAPAERAAAAKVMPFPGKGPRLTAEERAFLPAALEVIETPASPTLRLTAAVLCSLITGAIVWTSLSHIDMVAVARGKGVAVGQGKGVQPLGAARV